MPYDFTADDFTKFTQDILQANGDQATLTSLIVDMQGTITEAVATSTKNTEKMQKLEQENERLRTRNLELFYQVGQEQRERAGLPHANLGEPDEEDKPKISTDDYMRSYFEKLDERK